jgi:hypothetical protein
MKAEKPTFANTSDITRKSRGEGCKGKEATHKSAISSLNKTFAPSRCCSIALRSRLFADGQKTSA